MRVKPHDKPDPQVLTITLVDPDGRPIAGLPVCSVAQTRASRSESCGVSGTDGRFTVRLRPNSDVYVEWEYLKFGDPLSDLPWKTMRQTPAEIASTTVTMQPRAAVTGNVTGAAGEGLAGESICAIPWEYKWGGAGKYRLDKTWCSETDAAGHYSLRVDGDEYIWVAGNPTSRGFIELMDPYLAAGEEAKDIDQTGGLRRWDIGTFPVTTPGCSASDYSCSWGAQVYRDMIARPGRQLDLALTDLVPGEDIRLAGRLTHAPLPDSADLVLAGYRVCAFSRAGFDCTQTDATGRYTLSLPTRVSPGDPVAPVAVKVVAPSGYGGWRPAVDRFAATPGSGLTRDLRLEP